VRTDCNRPVIPPQQEPCKLPYVESEEKTSPPSNYCHKAGDQASPAEDWVGDDADGD